MKKAIKPNISGIQNRYPDTFCFDSKVDSFNFNSLNFTYATSDTYALFAAISNIFCHKKLVTTEHNTNNRKMQQYWWEDEREDRAEGYSSGYPNVWNFIEGIGNREQGTGMAAAAKNPKKQYITRRPNLEGY